MHNESPTNLVSFTINSFLNLKVCTSILGKFRTKSMGLSRKVLQWGPSEDPRCPTLWGSGVPSRSG